MTKNNLFFKEFGFTLEELQTALEESKKGNNEEWITERLDAISAILENNVF